MLQTDDLSASYLLGIPDDPDFRFVLDLSFLELTAQDHLILRREEDRFQLGFSDIDIVVPDIDHSGDDGLDLLKDVIDDFFINELDLRILERGFRVRDDSDIVSHQYCLACTRHDHIRVVDVSDSRMDDLDLRLSGGKLPECLLQRFKASVRFRLDNHLELLEVSCFDAIQEELKRGSFELIEALRGLRHLEFMGLLFCCVDIRDDLQDVSPFCNIAQSGNEDRGRWSCFVDIPSFVILQGAQPSIAARADDVVALLQCPGIHEDGRKGSELRIQMRLDDGGNGWSLRIGLEIEHFRYEEDHLDECVDSQSGECGDRHDNRFSSPILWLESLLGKLSFDEIKIRARLVHLVDRDDDHHSCFLRVVDTLYGLRFDSFIRSHDDDGDVGELRSSGAHDGEGLMSGSIQECYPVPVLLDLVGTDLLGDSSGFSCCDVRLADIVEDRRLPVIDMPHDADDRSSANLLHRIVVLQEVFDIPANDARNRDLVLLFLHDLDIEKVGDDEAGLKIDPRIQIHHHPVLQEFSDHLGHRDSDLVAELLDGQEFRQRYLLTGLIGKCLPDIVDILVLLLCKGFLRSPERPRIVIAPHRALCPNPLLSLEFLRKFGIDRHRLFRWEFRCRPSLEESGLFLVG